MGAAREQVFVLSMTWTHFEQHYMYCSKYYTLFSVCERETAVKYHCCKRIKQLPITLQRRDVCVFQGSNCCSAVCEIGSVLLYLQTALCRTCPPPGECVRGVWAGLKDREKGRMKEHKRVEEILCAFRAGWRFGMGPTHTKAGKEQGVNTHLSPKEHSFTMHFHLLIVIRFKLWVRSL